jgi:hypothetical protein
MRRSPRSRLSIAAARESPGAGLAGDGRVRNNPAHSMTRAATNELVGACAAVFALALYAGLILIPAWNSYSRVWERLAATILSLYVLAVLVGIGVAGALAAIYFWD